MSLLGNLLCLLAVIALVVGVGLGLLYIAGSFEP